jgi:hypothetical protein
MPPARRQRLDFEPMRQPDFGPPPVIEYTPGPL